MDQIDEKTPPEVITSDTDNATQVRPSEAPPHKREKFRRFRAYNTGLWNGPRRENTEQFRRQDDLHRYDAISSTLDLTTQQKQRGRRILDSLTLNEFTSPGESVDAVAFAICVLVTNNAVEDGTRYYPPPDLGGNDDLFADFANSLDLETSDQMSLIERVRAQVNL